MDIKCFTWKVINSNSWLITEGSKGILVDAIDSGELLAEISKLEELIVVITHSHFDHICGLNRIREIAGVKLICISTRQCSYNIGNIHKNMSASANAFMAFYSGNTYIKRMEPIICEPADILFDDQLFFEWCGHNVVLYSFWGHSNDSLIMVMDGKIMFSGDTILSIPTVTRFPGGSTEKFWKYDIPKLKEFNVEIVYPGHGEPGKLDDMIASNIVPEKYSER